MPVYNGETYVASAVDSILRQTLSDLELIVIDDGSTDSTSSMLRTISRRDKRVRIVTNARNYGIPISLNTGIEAARGRFLARQDADDVSHPERLARQVESLDGSKLAALGTAVRYFRSEIKSATWRVTGYKEEIKAVSVKYGNVLTHGSLMFETRLLREYRYSEGFAGAEDFDLLTRMEEAGLRLGMLCVPLYAYRIPVVNRRGFEYYLASLRVQRRFAAYRFQGVTCRRPCEAVFRLADSCYRMSYTVESRPVRILLKVAACGLYPPTLVPYIKRAVDVSIRRWREQETRDAATTAR